MIEGELLQRICELERRQDCLENRIKMLESGSDDILLNLPAEHSWKLIYPGDDEICLKCKTLRYYDIEDDEYAYRAVGRRGYSRKDPGCVELSEMRGIEN